MKQSDIPIYNDPDDFKTLGDTAKYPCSTQYMIYDAMISRYFLTVDKLEDYGITIYAGHNPKQLLEFIEELSDDLYGVIARLAPFNYEYSCWLIAQSRSLRFPRRYAARKEFEKALAYITSSSERSSGIYRRNLSTSCNLSGCYSMATYPASA